MCAISVATYPGTIDRIIFVPGVKPDVPLCYLRFGSIIVVLAPNSFLAIVDILSSPLSVLVLPRSFATVSSGICCISGPLPNHIIDLDNADVFELRLTLETIRFVAQPILRAGVADASSRLVWDAMTQICARVCAPEHFSHLLNILCEVNDLKAISHVFRVIFQHWDFPTLKVKPKRPKHKMRSTLSDLSIEVPSLKSHKRFPPGTFERLRQIEEDNPRADGRSWQSWFISTTKALVKEYKTYEAASAQVFQDLEQELQHVRMLRQALDTWTKEFNPDPFIQLLIGIQLQSETMIAHYPAVPCLAPEIEALSEEFVSGPLKHRLASVGVTTYRMEEEEATFWRRKLGGWLEERSETDSGSSSVRSSKFSTSLSRTRSLDSKFELMSETSESASMDGLLRTRSQGG
jgi:hypothetical protein